MLSKANAGNNQWEAQKTCNQCKGGGVGGGGGGGGGGEENISKYDVERCVAFDQELASCLYLEFGYCCCKK